MLAEQPSGQWEDGGMDREPTETSRALAAYVVDAVGGTLSVHRYYNDDETADVDVLALGPDADGITVHSTVSLHETPNLMDGRDIRVELIIATDGSIVGAPEALATMALTVGTDGWLAAPGVVYSDVFAMYEESTPFPHALMTDPFPWPDLARWGNPDGPDVHWLLVVPLAESERQLLVAEGEDALLERLEAADAPHFTSRRAPVA